MSHEVICAWLGLPADGWPPDHYQLLGLRAGEDDVALIEQRVHQRLDSVRRYQMMHPEQATEAMNRLAQAFVCLTEPATKRAYDLQLLGPQAAPAPTPPPPPPPPALAPVPPSPQPAPQPAPEPAPVATAVSAPAPVPAGKPDALSWLYAPPPVRANSDNRALPPTLLPQLAGPAVPPPVRTVPPPLPVPPPAPPVPPPPPVLREKPTKAVEPPPPAPPPPAPAPPPPPPPPKPVDPLRDSAQRSPAALGGLSTKRALYKRLVRTRQLLGLWRKLGAYFDKPSLEEPLNKQQATEVVRLLKQLEEAMEDFPAPLGELGQGYYVVNLTQAESPRLRIQALTLTERESLQRDWKGGLEFLHLHREMLRQESETMRRRSSATRLWLAVRAFLNEHSWPTVIIALAVLAIAAALVRTFWRALT